MHHRIVDNPEATAKVARALTIAVLHVAAAAQPENEDLKKAAPTMGDHVGKAVGKLIARTQRHASEGPAAIDPGTAPDTTATGPGATATGPDTPAGPDTTATGPDTPAGPGAAAAGPDAAAAKAPTSASADVGAGPAELAESLGVRPPPDPTALYREGPGTFELVLPLPAELASLPWGSLTRRNRFSLLVAAWALREADGITLLKGGRLDQAGEVFQECLIRAQYVHTPELVVRSYEDLAELATVSGDEKAAQAWRAAAAQSEGAG
jgi:hypothetical protein